MKKETNFRVAVKAFIVNNNRLLIIKRAKDEPQMPNAWEIPGGRLNLGENPFDGVKREIKEETNLDIEIISPLNVRHFKRKDGQTITMIIFLCRPIGGKIQLSKEHSRYEGIDIDSAKDKLTSFFHEEVDRFNRFFSHKKL